MEISSVSSAAVNRPMASSTPEAIEDTDDSASSASSATSATATSSATPEKKTSAAGGYISPFLRYDQGARVAVLLFRDVDSGETQDQIPSQRVVEEYRRAAGRLNQPGAKDDESASTDTTQKAAGQATAGYGGNVARGISFASFGSTSSAAASFSAGNSGGPSSSASSTSAPPTPMPVGGGSGRSSPGGLVSVTV